MADLTKSAGALIAEVRAAVSKELLDSLRPIVKKMTETAEELERALGGAVLPKTGRPGRKAKVAAAPKLVRDKRSVNPRGSLQAAIREALQKARGGMRLSALCDQVLENKLFKGRDKKGLYNQIAGAIKPMTDVVKSADNSYTLVSAAGEAKASGSKAKKTVSHRPAKTSKPAAETGKE